MLKGGEFPSVLAPIVPPPFLHQLRQNRRRLFSDPQIT
jgi:hypothetical protein